MPDVRLFCGFVSQPGALSTGFITGKTGRPGRVIGSRFCAASLPGTTQNANDRGRVKSPASTSCTDNNTNIVIIVIIDIPMM